MDGMRSGFADDIAFISKTDSPRPDYTDHCGSRVF